VGHLVTWSPRYRKLPAHTHTIDNSFNCPDATTLKIVDTSKATEERQPAINGLIWRDSRTCNSLKCWEVSTIMGIKTYKRKNIVPSRTKATMRGEKSFISSYLGVNLPLFLAELTNFPIVIPKKTTSCVISITVLDTEAFHTWYTKRRNPWRVKTKRFICAVYPWLK